MTTSSNARQVGDFVSDRAAGLAKRYIRDSSEAKAMLARLRRSVAADPGVDIAAWSDIFEGFPDELVGRGDAPNSYERAAHLALALFAIHQQSNQDHSVHVPLRYDKGASRTGLGHAVRRLANPSDAEQRTIPVMRRFLALSTAEEFSEISHHLRGLVQQFRSARDPIYLDYGQLASDLCALQYPDSAPRVRLRWARELHYSDKATDSTNAADADVPSDT